MARRRPALTDGLWFGAAALLPAAAMGVYYLLLVAVEGPLVAAEGLPLDAFMAGYLVLLPPLIAFLVGGLAGRRILRRPPLSRFEASGWGAMVGVLSLLLWFGVGELAAVLLGIRAVSGSPGELVAFGYGLAALGSLVLVAYDAAIGVWLLGASRGWDLGEAEETRPRGTY